MPVGVRATAAAVFDTIDTFFVKEGINWDKCMAVTTDGAAVMLGKQNGVVTRIKEKSPECISLHCIIHREALVSKKLFSKNSQNTENHGLKVVIDNVVKIINSIKGKSKQHRIFSSLCDEMDAVHNVLIQHSEVRWLSRGKILTRFFELREELKEFLESKKDPYAKMLSNNWWMLKLAYLACIFDRLNALNLSLQGKQGDIFTSYSKIEGLKKKFPIWRKHVRQNDFSDFPLLKQYLKNCGWETEEEDQDIENTVRIMVVSHLDVLSQNLEAYFPSENHKKLQENMWIIQPFNATETDDEVLVELQNDVVQKATFNSVGSSYSEFWVSLLNVPKYENLTEKAMKYLIQMPTTYLCEQAFSCMLDIKSKKRNRIKNLDSLMRGAMEKTVLPRFDTLAMIHQEQSSH